MWVGGEGTVGDPEVKGGGRGRGRRREGGRARWLVFVMLEGKVGYRWYLWVFHSREVVIFILAAGRSHDVPEEHLGPVRVPGSWW